MPRRRAVTRFPQSLYNRTKMGNRHRWRSQPLIFTTAMPTEKRFLRAQWNCGVQILLFKQIRRWSHFGHRQGRSEPQNRLLPVLPANYKILMREEISGFNSLVEELPAAALLIWRTKENSC